MIFQGIIRVFQFLVALFVARLLLRGLVGLFAPRPRPVQPSPGPRTLEAMEMVRDPVCNTFIPRKAAVIARLSGTDEFFCSETCRDKAIEALRKTG